MSLLISRACRIFGSFSNHLAFKLTTNFQRKVFVPSSLRISLEFIHIFTYNLCLFVHPLLHQSPFTKYSFNSNFALNISYLLTTMSDNSIDLVRNYEMETLFGSSLDSPHPLFLAITYDRKSYPYLTVMSQKGFWGNI